MERRIGSALREGTPVVLCALLFLILLALWIRFPDFAAPGGTVQPSGMVVIDGVSCLDINSASAGQLEMLPYVGGELAQGIVEYRDSAGSFESIDELTNVSGIGTEILDAIRDRLCVMPYGG